MDMESSLTNWKQRDNIAWKIKVRNLNGFKKKKKKKKGW
jgi:hypothetical protein